MSGQDLMQELNDKVNLLNKALSALPERGRSYAMEEYYYRVALSKDILTERSGGLPVTIVSDVCRGKEAIAELKFKRDVAEVMYKSALEAINGYKLQIKILENQIDREYRG